MKTKASEVVEQMYADACRELGHLLSNRRRIDARVAELEARIDQLDELAGLSKVLTQAPVQEQKLEQKS